MTQKQRNYTVKSEVKKAKRTEKNTTRHVVPKDLYTCINNKMQPKFYSSFIFKKEIILD